MLKCDDPKRLQAICDGLSAEKIDALLRKWLRLLATSVHRCRSQGRLSLPGLDAADRVLVDSGAGPSCHGPGVLRRGDSRKSRHRQTQSGAVDLRSPCHGADTGPVSHARDYRRSGSLPACRLQEHTDQAVSQGGPRPAHRNHHQQHPRLRHRQTIEESARPAGRSAFRPTGVFWTSRRVSHDCADWRRRV